MGRPPSDLDDYLDWQERLESYRASGLGVDVFCLQEGVSRSTFYRWVDRLRHGLPGSMVAEKAARQRAESGEAAFVPITLKASPVEIQLPNGGIVRLPLVASFPKGAKDAHQDRLRVCALARSIPIAVLAHDDGGTNFSLVQVVVKRDSLLVQKRENVILMPTQTLDQTFGMRIFPGGVDLLLEAAGQPPAPRSIGRLVVRVAPVPQADPVAQQATKFLHELRRILARRLVFLGVFQLAKEVHQASLTPRACDGVVSAPEVADQRALEYFGKKPQKRRAAARAIDHEIGQQLVEEICGFPNPLEDAP